MKKLTVILFSLLMTIVLYANIESCKGNVSWDENTVLIDYDNGEFEEMEIMTFYQDHENDMFVITALTADDKITRIIVKKSPVSYSITIEHRNPDNSICKETYYQNKY